MKDIIVDSNKVTKNDYPELEGKIINYKQGGQQVQGVVIGCNRSVGLTVVNPNDKSEFIVCAAGPIMPDFEKNQDSFINAYDVWFDMMVDGIQAGCIDGDATLALYQVSTFVGCADGSNCAYSR